MIRYPPQNRQRCRCGRCALCQSRLTDNYSDEECKAYNWLLAQGIGGWMINNQTKCVIDHTTNRVIPLMQFAKEKGMP